MHIPPKDKCKELHYKVEIKHFHQATWVAAKGNSKKGHLQDCK